MSSILTHLGRGIGLSEWRCVVSPGPHHKPLDRSAIQVLKWIRLDLAFNNQGASKAKGSAWDEKGHVVQMEDDSDWEEK